MLFKFLLATLALFTTACQQPSTTFCGTFEGVLPAADGAGIDTKISFHPNGSFSKTLIYQSAPDQIFKESGTFKKEDGDILALSSANGYMSYYLIETGQIRQLSFGKSVIEGPLSENYVLFQTRGCF